MRSEKEIIDEIRSLAKQIQGARPKNSNAFHPLHHLSERLTIAQHLHP